MSLLKSLPKGARATLAIIAVSGLCWLAQGASQQQFTGWAVLYGPAVSQGDWWRVISNAFVHGGIAHLIFNMGLLFALGQQLEQAIGALRFILIYAGATAAASLAIMLFASNQPTLGASGAVMGIAVAFALILILYTEDNRYQSLLVLVAMNLAIPLIFPGISFWGHFGGAVGGLLIALIVIVVPQQARKRQISERGVYEAERQPMLNQALIAGGVLVAGLFAASIKAAG